MTTRQYSTQFSRLKVGKHFSKNGNKWLKRSTRTAEIVLPEEYAGKWFYFGMDEQIIIDDPSIID